MRIAVLEFVTHQGDTAERLNGVDLQFSAKIVAAGAPARGGPQLTRDKPEETRLATAVGAGHSPMLARNELPVDILKHGTAQQLHVHVF